MLNYCFKPENKFWGSSEGFCLALSLKASCSFLPIFLPSLHASLTVWWAFL